MSAPERRPRLYAILSEPVLGIGGVALVAMMLATVADVVGRNLFGLSVPGVVEIVSLTMVWCTFAGIGAAFVAGGHIAVDLIDTVAPGAVARGVRTVAAIVCVAAMGVLTALALQELSYIAEWGDTTVDLGIPLTAFWAAIAAGYSMGALGALAALIIGPKG